MHFLRFIEISTISQYSTSVSLFRDSWGTLAVIFSQPAISNFPCFIQCSEQIKILYLCSVCVRLNRSIKAFCVGLPSLIISSITPCSSAHCASVSETSSDRYPSAFLADIRGLPRFCPAPSRPSAPGYSGQFRSPVHRA